MAIQMRVTSRPYITTDSNEQEPFEWRDIAGILPKKQCAEGVELRTKICVNEREKNVLPLHQA